MHTHAQTNTVGTVMGVLDVCVCVCVHNRPECVVIWLSEVYSELVIVDIKISHLDDRSRRGCGAAARARIPALQLLRDEGQKDC